MKNLSIFLVSLLFIVIAYVLLLDRAQKKIDTASDFLPNNALTPGSINPNVTQENIQETICKAGWTATVRPPTSYTSKLKIEMIAQYGYSDTDPSHYELDHDDSIELGGHPTDPKNLWPQKYPQAHDKDKVENELHREVCNGTITLKEAQRIISTDWLSFFNKKLGVDFGSVSSEDPDDESFVPDLQGKG